MLKKYLFFLALVSSSFSEEDWQPHDVEYEVQIPFERDDNKTWPIRFKTVTPENADASQEISLIFKYPLRRAWGRLRWREADWAMELYPCTNDNLDYNNENDVFHNVPEGRTKIWEVSWGETFTIKCNGTTVWSFELADGLYSDCKDTYTDSYHGELESWKFRWSEGNTSPVTYYTYLQGKRDREEREEREREERERQEREREDRERQEEERRRQEEEERVRPWTEAIVVYDHVRIKGEKPLYAAEELHPTSTSFLYYDNHCLNNYDLFYNVVEDDSTRDENSLWNVKLLNVSGTPCHVIEKAAGYLAGYTLTWVYGKATRYGGGPWEYIVGLKPRNLFGSCVQSCWKLLPEDGGCSKFRMVSAFDENSAVKRRTNRAGGCAAYNRDPLYAVGYSKPNLCSGCEGAIWEIEG